MDEIFEIFHWRLWLTIYVSRRVLLYPSPRSPFVPCLFTVCPLTVGYAYTVDRYKSMT